MDTTRKDAIKQFKASKPALGIYAFRCAITGCTWVGESRNLEATRNRLWFGLRLGSHHDRGLQEHWNNQNGEAFEYEILEQLKDDVPELLMKGLLKQKKVDWISRLNAKPLL